MVCNASRVWQLQAAGDQKTHIMRKKYMLLWTNERGDFKILVEVGKSTMSILGSMEDTSATNGAY